MDLDFIYKGPYSKNRTMQHISCAMYVVLCEDHKGQVLFVYSHVLRHVVASKARQIRGAGLNARMLVGHTGQRQTIWPNTNDSVLAVVDHWFDIATGNRDQLKQMLNLVLDHTYRD
jgi:hypothetical protein